MDGCRVVALIGLPGSGKSTLAARLCGRFGLALLDRDAIRAELFPDCRYTEAEKRAANAEVLERLRRNCRSRVSSVIDGMTLGRVSEREAVSTAAGECGARVLMLWLDCPVEIAATRVAAQPHLAADRSPELVRTVAARFERPDDAVRLDAALPMGEIYVAAERALLS